MRTILVLAAAASAIALPAAAQSLSSPEYYGTVGYTYLDHKSSNLGTVTGRVGAKLSPYWGVEAEAGFAAKTDHYLVNGQSGKIKASYDAALYGVGTWPINDNVELFARVGFGTTSFQDQPSAGGKLHYTDNSWNLGLGGNWYFNDANGVRLDWTNRNYRHDTGHINAYSLNYVRRF